MMSQIEVNGFRSLHKFLLALQPGLNVLVGPNGAGKTNIIAFFEFISNYAMTDAANVIGEAGGTTSVFSVETTNEDEAYLGFKILGVAPLDPYRPTRRRTSWISYEYTSVVRFIRSESAVAITQERIRFSDSWVSSAKLQIPRGELIHDMEISRDPRSLSETPTVRIEFAETEFGEKVQRDLLRFTNFKTVELAVLDQLKASPPQASLINSLNISYRSVFGAIRHDLYTGYNFNIVPAKAKAADDLSSAAGIDPDGSGLSATLHALSALSASGKSYTIHANRHWRYLSKEQKEGLFPEIEALTNLVNEHIKGIEVPQSMELGKYIGKFRIAVADTNDELKKDIYVPFVNASDGTIKWVALVTALLTDTRMLAIEEPENFLHPAMQSEIVAVCRERITRSLRNDFIFLSTHSETLLNSCKPEELVVVNLYEGHTIAHRPENASLLSDEIRETGFGLGSFYVSNAVN